LLLLVILVFTACSETGNRRLVVGSKNFTEQTVLAEVLAQYLGSKLAVEVDRRVNLGGTLICHEAVKSGQIDLYVEYTGTALPTVLNEESSGDPVELRHRAHHGLEGRISGRSGGGAAPRQRRLRKTVRTGSYRAVGIRQFLRHRDAG